MVAIVSRERARATWLTGLAGLLLLSAALTMMAVAAPAHVRPPAAQKIAQKIVLESDSTSAGVPWSRLRP
jgi:hypothetical protein